MPATERAPMPNEPTPKDRCTSLDLRAVVHEARGLVGGRLDKAFDLEPEGLGLTFRARSVGRTELRIVPGRYAAIVGAGQEHADGLSPLARDVRRLLTGASVEEVVEPAGERYLELRLRRGSDPSPTVLGAELFGTGNIVLVRDGTVVAVLHARRWARRELRVGATYVPPPVRDDAFALGPAAIEAELARSRTDLASTLAARLALGGPVAEEVVARGGWDPGSAAAPTAHELAPAVHTILRDLLAEVGNAPQGYLYLRGSTTVDATPYRSCRWEPIVGAELRTTPTFSEAAVEYFGSLVRPLVPPEVAARAAERAALERLRDRQGRALQELADAVADRRAEAEAVFAHYAEAEAALAQARAEGPTPRTVRIQLGGREVELATAGDARRAAQTIYEEGKRLGEKLDGARVALAATEARLAAEPAPLPARAARRTRSAGGGTSRWFEKFRWFASSEGLLVLAGRDASSNDLLVRRHLKDGDLFLHADLHGAASVVAKRAEGGSGVGETTVREAAQWAVAFSKAWRAGLASASAFWATPDQVSKSAGSGEFVARGAWVVRGTKHFVHDLPLELAVGTVRYYGEEFLSVAPPDAVRSRGTVRFLLAPGDERERSEREVELSRELDVPRTRLQGLLPAGGLTVRRP
jgi:predicted ribosome quality control (RQC) complex YloA/Tae2 family protein